jgi:hypothetical protein
MAQDAIPWMFIAAGLLFVFVVAGAAAFAQTSRDNRRRRGTLEIVTEAAAAVVDASAGR